MKIYTIETSKEALKFSAAHVATFQDGSIERLHGHNYHVTARLSGELDRAGMVLDVGILKQWVRELCDELDEHVLIPLENPLVAVEHDEREVRVAYESKRYVFPREDCVLLPIENTTMEYLAHYLAERLSDRLKREPSAERMTALEVTVSETPGQGAGWRLEI
ncbi:6-carboxytetrahydropterin synthase [bacterium]|nr:6-carboxytetrahydropterin synthase [bacterium]